MMEPRTRPGRSMVAVDVVVVVAVAVAGVITAGVGSVSWL
jgi:hypothetical protein